MLLPQFKLLRCTLFCSASVDVGVRLKPGPARKNRAEETEIRPGRIADSSTAINTARPDREVIEPDGDVTITLPHE